MQYIRNQAKIRKEKSRTPGAAQPAAGRSRSYGRAAAKPDIPIVQSSANEGEVTEEEFAELLKMAEQMQASKNKGSM
ncbi:hypothetical protein D3C77_365890 [compost metagenome]